MSDNAGQVGEPVEVTSDHIPLGLEAVWGCGKSLASPPSATTCCVMSAKSQSSLAPVSKLSETGGFPKGPWSPGHSVEGHRGALWVPHNRHPHLSSIRAVCLEPFYVRFHLQKGFCGLKEILKSSGRMSSEDPSSAMIFYDGLIIRWFLSVGGASCAIFEVCACVQVCLCFLELEVYFSAGSY